MNAPNWLRASLLVLAGAGLAAFVRSEPPRQRWEHLCRGPLFDRRAALYSWREQQADSINRLGANGWEMVAVTSEGGGRVGLCFKRLRQP